MHELSIAMSIVDIALEEAKKAGGGNVREVVVKIGTLSGILPEALMFSWDVATSNSLAMGSLLKIEPIPATARCSDCMNEFNIKQIMAICPDCGSHLVGIISGREMKVESILLD